MTTETRTYVGETGTRAHDGFAGFVIDRQYELSYTREFDEVRLVLPHASPGGARRSLSGGFGKSHAMCISLKCVHENLKSVHKNAPAG